VAGVRKLVAAGQIHRDDDVIAVLTGHALKDPDYMIRYHDGTLSFVAQKGSGPLRPLGGAFPNAPRRVAANKADILSSLERRQ